MNKHSNWFVPEKCLLIGGSGKLGTELQKIGRFIAPLTRDLNILNETTIRKYINDSIHGVVHLAAMTNVNEAEQNKLRAYEINVIGTRNIAKRCVEVNKKLFYVSTDYVFGGKIGNYDENSIPNPLNWYGVTKLCAEYEIRLNCKRWCIIRTSFRPTKWLFPTAYSNVVTSADYIDVIAREIKDCIEIDMEGIIHIGTEPKSLYELALRRNRNIKSEICNDHSVPLNRYLNIELWRRIKKTYKKTLERHKNYEI